MSLLNNNSNQGFFFFASTIIHLLLLIFFAAAINKTSNNLTLDLTRINIDFGFETAQTNDFDEQNDKKHKQIVDKQSKIPSLIEEKIVKSSKKGSQEEKISYVNNTDINGFKPSPKYPKRALMLSQEGTVILNALVDSTGSVLQINIVKSSGFRILDEAAKSSIAKWRFRPDQEKNLANKFWVKIPVEFIIS